VSLDPNEGDIHNEPINEDEYISIIKKLYNIIWHREDYVNPTFDGELRWRSICSYDTYLEEAMDIWKNNLYEVSTERCM
jgi:hypothetical protein